MDTNKNDQFGEIRKNYRIEGLRGLLILWIILFHYTFRFKSLGLGKSVDFAIEFSNGGEVGVMMFLIISGYFTGQKLLSSEGGFSNSMRWFFKRYWRLWPSYAVAVLIIGLWMFFLPVDSLVVDVWAFLCNFLFISHPGVDYVDGAHWYVAALVEIQLLIAIIYTIKNRRLRQFILVGILMSMVVAMQMMVRLQIELPLELYWFMLGCEGILVGICFSWYKESGSFLIIAIPIVLWLAHLTILYAIYIFIFVLCLYRGNLTINKWLDKCLANRFLVRIGNLSFCWYLIHQNIGFSMMYHFLPEKKQSVLWVAIPIVVTFLLAMTISYVSKLIMNSRISKFLK